ncbi:hypothetical protein HK100_003910, partial [Physocladia obscura]
MSRRKSSRLNLTQAKENIKPLKWNQKKPQVDSQTLFEQVFKHGFKKLPQNGFKKPVSLLIPVANPENIEAVE